jgi:MinD superfamily P-loop ATPase
VSGIHDAVRVFELCLFFNIKAGLIVNKSDINLKKAEELKDIALNHKADFLGMVPYDKTTTEAQTQNKTIIEYNRNSPAATAIEEIWDNLIKKVNK